MPDNEKPNLNTEQQGFHNGEDIEEMHLDDARRVKVLSPGMLVFKRFIRNRLAVIGFVILLFMFLFSFLGPFLSPYGQTQVFKGVGSMSKDYAGAIYNEELRYTVVEGERFGSAERAQFLLTLGNNNETFSYGDDIYYYVSEGEGIYRILQLDPIAEELLGSIHSLVGGTVSDAFIEAYRSAVDEDLSTFEFDGVSYRITKKNKASQISTEHDVALAMFNVFDSYNESDSQTVSSYDFKLASVRALALNKTTFVTSDQTYSIRNDEGQSTILDKVGNEYAEVSDIIVNPIDQSLFLPVDFKGGDS